jgi:hypothetical protein
VASRGSRAVLGEEASVTERIEKFITGTPRGYVVGSVYPMKFAYSDEFIKLLIGSSYGISFRKPMERRAVDVKWNLPIGQFFDMEAEYKQAIGTGQIDPQEMQEWQEVTYTRTRKLRGASTSAKSTTVSPSPWLPSWKRPHGSDSSPDTSNAG